MSVLDWSVPLAPIGPPSGGLAPSPSVDLNLRMETQLAGQWCWAACTQCVRSFYQPGAPLTQCVIASCTLVVHNEVPQGTPCCEDDPDKGPCDMSYYLDRSLSEVGHFNLWSGNSLSGTDLMTEMQASRPVGARIQWPNDGGGHFLVIGGLSPGTGIIVVHDPLEHTDTEGSQMPIAEFTTSYKTGYWSDSYFTK